MAVLRCTHVWNVAPLPCAQVGSRKAAFLALADALGCAVAVTADAKGMFPGEILRPACACGHQTPTRIASHRIASPMRPPTPIPTLSPHPLSPSRSVSSSHSNTEDHPGFIGHYWGSISAEGVCETVEGSDIVLSVVRVLVCVVWCVCCVCNVRVPVGGAVVENPQPAHRHEYGAALQKSGPETCAC